MLPLRLFASRSQVVLGLLLAGAACAQAEGFTSERGATGGADGDTGGTGGTGETGGMAAGGTTSTTGGTVAKGGTTSTGGTASTTGGTVAKGGTTSTGGTASTTGGTVAKGGTTGAAGSPGKSGDVLLSDDFEDQDATDWYAADMNGTRAIATEDASYAYVMTTTDKALSVGGSVNWVNQRVEAKVKFVAGESAVIYLEARWADAKSYIVIELRQGTAAKPVGDMKLRQTFTGSTADLCRFKPTSVLPGTWYTIGLSVSGGLNSTATLLFDGQPVTADKPCVLTKDGPANGGIAIGVQDGTAAFDDITVTVP